MGENIIEELKEKIEEVIKTHPDISKIEIIVHKQSWLFLRFVLFLLAVLCGVFLGMILTLEVFRGII